MWWPKLCPYCGGDLYSQWGGERRIVSCIQCSRGLSWQQMRELVEALKEASLSSDERGRRR